MIAAVALTVAGAALVGTIEYTRIHLVRARFARAVHAQRRAVPSGPVPLSNGGTVATTTHTPASTGGGGPVRQCVSHDAPAQIGPAGARIPLPRNPRPGHNGGAA